MGTMHHLHPGYGDGDTTVELDLGPERLADARRLERLLRQRAHARPDCRYLRATIAMSVLAGLDWLAVAVHTTAASSKPPPAWLGTHQAFVATLTIAACSLWMGWSLWNGACRREAQRDEMEQIRHRQLLDAVGRAAGAAEQRAWLSYTTGLRDAAGQVIPRPEPDAAVRQLRHQRRPGR